MDACVRWLDPTPNKIKSNSNHLEVELGSVNDAEHFVTCRDRSRSREREYRGREEDRKYYEDRYRERERREGDRDRERWIGEIFSTIKTEGTFSNLYEENFPTMKTSCGQKYDQKLSRIPFSTVISRETRSSSDARVKEEPRREDRGGEPRREERSDSHRERR